MYFLVLGYDGKDSQAPQRRQAVREAHLKLNEQLRCEGKVLFAAAMLDDNEQMCGSALTCEFESRAELDAWLKDEPYVIGKVWERLEIMPCKIPPSYLNRS